MRLSKTRSRIPSRVPLSMVEPPRQTWLQFILRQQTIWSKALLRTRCRRGRPAPEPAVRQWFAVPCFRAHRKVQRIRALGHRQCMEILVRQECRRERCEEQLEELKVKLREETQRRRAFSPVMKLPA